jgi:hypothetical protein
MAHTVSFGVSLGAGSAGLTLSAQIKDVSGANIGGPITTGFVDLSGGFYSWTGSIPDGQLGTVEFLSLGVVKAIASLNPAETEVLPSVAQIDAQLTSAHGAGPWGASFAGLGASAVPITVLTTGSAPVIGASLTIKNAAMTATVAGPLSTDINGLAVFALNDGAYRVIVASNTLYLPLAPVSLTVLGTTPLLLTLTAAPVVSPGPGLRFLDADSPAQVRKLLDLGLEQDALPDEVIQQSIYAGAAEAELMERDPNAITYPEGSIAKERAVRAAILLTAARLAPSLPGVVTERLGDWQFTQTPPDLTAIAASLRGMAAQQISLNVNGRANVPLPSFWLASGARGR